MPGIMESTLGGALSGISNAFQQNMQMQNNSDMRKLDYDMKMDMDARVAERNKTLEADQHARNIGDEVTQHARNRGEALADQKTAQGNALELQRERNKGYSARATGGAKGMAGFNAWKEDNPDGTYEEFLQTISSSKVNDNKLIADTAQKLLAEERKNFNDKYTMDQAIADAKKLHGDPQASPAPATKIPKKPLSAF